MLPAKFNQAQRRFRRLAPRTRAEHATYDHVDEHRMLFQVVRYVGKDLRQRRPDGAGGWIWRLGEARRVLYHLDELTQRGGPVYVAEGEKDADRLRQHAQVATCNPCGARGWRAVSDCAREVLAGRDVVVIADRDDSGVGRKHAREVDGSLRGFARSIRIVVGHPLCKDASDLFDTRPGKDTASILRELIDLDEYEASMRTAAF
jgi:putative DNA primase/helicase